MIKEYPLTLAILNQLRSHLIDMAAISELNEKLLLDLDGELLAPYAKEDKKPPYSGEVRRIRSEKEQLDLNIKLLKVNVITLINKYVKETQ